MIESLWHGKPFQHFLHILNTYIWIFYLNKKTTSEINIPLNKSWKMNEKLLGLLIWRRGYGDVLTRIQQLQRAVPGQSWCFTHQKAFISWQCAIIYYVLNEYSGSEDFESHSAQSILLNARPFINWEENSYFSRKTHPRMTPRPFTCFKFVFLVLLSYTFFVVRI